MAKKLKIFILGLFLVTMGTAGCGVSEDRDIPQSNQVNVQENTENKENEDNNQTDTQEHQLSNKEKQIGKEALKLKEKGIVNQHGKPAPGIDLRNYPGLG